MKSNICLHYQIKSQISKIGCFFPCKLLGKGTINYKTSIGMQQQLLKMGYINIHKHVHPETGIYMYAYALHLYMYIPSTYEYVYMYTYMDGIYLNMWNIYIYIYTQTHILDIYMCISWYVKIKIYFYIYAIFHKCVEIHDYVTAIFCGWWWSNIAV